MDKYIGFDIDVATRIFFEASTWVCVTIVGGFLGPLAPFFR
jgi:hypothetical protein